MNRRIARLTIGLAAAFAVLVIQLTNIGYFSAGELRGHELNTRSAAAIGAPRGAITSTDGETIAPAIGPSPDGSRQFRSYPHGPLYAHVAGYLAHRAGADGLERHYDAELAGSASDIALERLADLFSDAQRVGDLTLTLHHGAQLTARAALGDRDGAIVVVDPATGAIVALWSRPSFNPNDIDTLAPEAPATMSGLPVARAYQLQYRLSAEGAADTAGGTLLEGAGRELGPTGIDLPREPDALDDDPALSLTPLQLALAAASVANDGVRMRPYVTQRITARPHGRIGPSEPDRAGSVHETVPRGAGRLFEPSDAEALLTRMTAEGNQAAMRITPAEGVELPVAIATGSVGDPTGGSVNTGMWAVLLAPAVSPTIAVAVLIEPDAVLDVGNLQGGGTLATMIAATAAEAALALRAVSTSVDDSP